MKLGDSSPRLASLTRGLPGDCFVLGGHHTELNLRTNLTLNLRQFLVIYSYLCQQSPNAVSYYWHRYNTLSVEIAAVHWGNTSITLLVRC